MIPKSELIITPDGKLYHLHLRPENIADRIILVGDPARVDMIANYFDYKELVEANREFVTITGLYKGERLTAMSTGIGVGNIDIVLNELDALANIDFKTREVKENKRVLNIVRIGTSGALQEDIPIGSYILSKKAIGLDGILNFQEGRVAITEADFEAAILESIPELEKVINPYVVEGSEGLFNMLNSSKVSSGVTLTAPGFYGSQGRKLRLIPTMDGFNDKIERFNFKGQRIVNYEMETSALYGFSKLLGHEAMTICLALANRSKKEALKDYNSEMMGLIEYVLNNFIE